MAQQAASPTQIRYLRALAEIGGTASAQRLFQQLRFSKLSLSRMGDAGLLVRRLENGKAHWTISKKGHALLEVSTFRSTMIAA